MVNKIELKRFFCQLTVAGLLLFWSCEENPNAVKLNQNAQIVTDTLYATIDGNVVISDPISTLNSTRLLLGASSAGFSFRPMFRFGQFPPDSIVIDSAWINLKTLQATGNISGNSFMAVGYPIKNFWLADTSDVWDDPDANIDRTALLGEMDVTDADSGSAIFIFNDLGIQHVQAWFDGDTVNFKNNGLILEFGIADFVKEFQARNVTSNIGPFLFYSYVSSSNDTLTDSLLALSDAFLFSGNYSRITPGNIGEPTRIYTTTFSPTASIYVDFDLQQLTERYKEGFIVESANLQMFIDAHNSIIHPDFRASLQILPMITPITDLDTAEVEVKPGYRGTEALTASFSLFPSGSDFIEVQLGEERQEFAFRYIQDRINDPESFTAFFIEESSANSHLSKLTFYRYNSLDPALRPRLIIRSLKLPEERF